MKRFFGFAVMLALLSGPAFAAKNSQTVQLPETVSVAGTQLPAGEYKVSWTGTGSNVQVTLKQTDTRNGATANFSAKLVQQNHDRAVLTINSEGGVKTLESIDLNHVSLVLSGSPASGQ
ncbi:MAG TPA: hypothetical protein VKB38_09770 [Terracidiphilus sp.]|nr:hypothetical protein [Terracidiphilus sp.]